MSRDYRLYLDDIETSELLDQVREILESESQKPDA